MAARDGAGRADRRPASQLDLGVAEGEALRNASARSSEGARPWDGADPTRPPAPPRDRGALRTPRTPGRPPRRTPGRPRASAGWPPAPPRGPRDSRRPGRERPRPAAPRPGAGSRRRARRRRRAGGRSWRGSRTGRRGRGRLRSGLGAERREPGSRAHAARRRSAPAPGVARCRRDAVIASDSPSRNEPGRPRSAAVTRPRCRSGSARESRDGRYPSGTARHRAVTESRSQRQWTSPATRLKTTPARSRSGSNRSKPSTTAPALRAIAPASTTRITGAPSHFAISAVEPSSLSAPPPPRPSKQPITPSMSARSAPAAWRATVARTCSREHIQPSRLYDGRPATSAWKPGSMKSGPTLNGCTGSPRRRSVSSRPRVTVVFPTPLPTPATTSAAIIGTPGARTPGWRHRRAARRPEREIARRKRWRPERAGLPIEDRLGASGAPGGSPDRSRRIRAASSLRSPSGAHLGPGNSAGR